MSEIDLSVVIPVYNEEKLLGACLDSFKNQNYKGNYEVIVVDNGSTDDSANIARHYGAKVVECREKGVFIARQVGADAASGQIIVQADADTRYPIDWLTRIDSIFKAHPEAVAVTGRYIYWNPHRWAKFEYKVRRFINDLCCMVLRKPMLISGAVLSFRRSSFLAVGGYHGLRMAPDQYGIVSRLWNVGKVLYSKELSAETSSRSVAGRSLIQIIFDATGYVVRWFVYFFKNRAHDIRKFTFSSPLRKAVTAGAGLSLILSILITSYFLPTSQVFGAVYYHGKTSEKYVAITFDDGPNEPYTSEILDILKSYDIKATFFLIGNNVVKYRETASRELAEGHVIGNHSYSHNPNHALSFYGMKDLSQAETSISSILGVTPHLYRPPHGRKTPWEIDYVDDQNMIEVDWSVTTNDQHAFAYFGKPNPVKAAKAILDDVKPGDIILLHDGYGTEHNNSLSDKSFTVKVLPLIIEGLKKEGYTFKTVPQILNVQPYNIK